MSNSEKNKNPAFDPVSALHALDIAESTQAAEAELTEVLAAFVPLLEAVKGACDDFDGLSEEQMSARAESVAMLPEMADQIISGLPLEPTAQPGMRVDKHKHEVVETVEGDSGRRGEIVQILEQGWDYRGLCVRRARVKARV